MPSGYPLWQIQREKVFSVRITGEPLDIERVTSGCVSSKGWYIQQELNLPGQKSKSRSLDSGAERNRSAKAYRRRYQKDNSESSGHNESEHIGGLVSDKFRRPSPQPWGEGNMTR